MRKISVLLILGLALLAITGCGGEAVDRASTIIVGLEAEPTSLDPTQISDFNSSRACMEIYDSLIRFKDGDVELEPGLATEWEVSEDGLEYTFTLREGVTFHDGTPFNADAVKFNIDRQIDEDHPYHDTGVFEYAFIFDEVEEVVVTADYEVKIILSEPFTPFLSNMAIHAAAMVSPAAVEKYGKDISNNPVGTGPYKFVSWDPGVEVILGKNEDCWRGVPEVERLIFRPITEDQTRLTELESGNVDFIIGIPPDDLQRLKKDSEFLIVEMPEMHTWYLSLNCQKPPFDDKLVRQAANYAINKKAIVDDILKGTGVLAKNLLPPLIWGYTDDVQDYSYDPDKARALLKEAGYEEGEIEFDFHVPKSGSGMQQPVPMAEAIQADLEAVGFKVTIKQLEWGTFLDEAVKPVETNEFVMHELSWLGDNGDPDNFLYTLLSGEQWPEKGFNDAFYKNNKVDRLLYEARTILDHDRRVELYQEAQKLIAEDSPVIVVDHEIQIVAMDKKIKGFELHPTGVFRFDKVTIE